MKFTSIIASALVFASSTEAHRLSQLHRIEANEDEKALTEAEAFLNDLDKENFDFHDLVHRGRGILHGMMQHFNKSH